VAGVVWDKDGAAVDPRVQRFLAGDDVVLDRDLFAFDLLASRAHVRGLGRIGVLSTEEALALSRELDALGDAFRAGTFALDDRFEDGHSAIEAHLVERLGDVGRKVHTGRSRNDQVLVATRLYLKDACARLDAAASGCARALLDRADADARTPLPGYTHLQRAVPSSVGHWLAGHAEAFLDDRDLARATMAWLDASPLGAAAGYGVNLPLDREGVADELGFARVVVNPQAAQNGRGKVEIQVLTALLQALLDVRRLAWDLSLFTTAEFGFVTLPPELTTGSSIMPNKKNPDVVELLRASPAVVSGALAEIQSLLSLPSGYQRDLQATKGPALRAIEKGLAALGIAEHVVRRMDFDRARMRAAIDAETFATDRAVELTAAGVPFRSAYRQVKGELATLAARSPEESLAARVSPGAPGNLMIDALRARLDGGAR
jgi:argininosuccinate lyase